MDSQILRFCNGRRFQLESIIQDLYYHFCWRQNNFPLPPLQDASIKLLNTGVLYVHGLSKDHCPIVVLDFIKLGELLKK